MGFGIFLLFLRTALLCFLSYFGIAYGCIRLYEVLMLYRPFSKELVSAGVYNHSTHRKLIQGQMVPFAGLTLISLVLSILLILFTPAGFFSAIACFVAGIIIYFRDLRGKKAMIRLFVHRYRRHMDESHLNAFLQKRYGMSVDELAAHTK